MTESSDPTVHSSSSLVPVLSGPPVPGIDTPLDQGRTEPGYQVVGQGPQHGRPWWATRITGNPTAVDDFDLPSSKHLVYLGIALEQPRSCYQRCIGGPPGASVRRAHGTPGVDLGQKHT